MSTVFSVFIVFFSADEQRELPVSQVLPAVVQVVTSPEYQHARWGILLVDRNTGEVLQNHNAEQLFIPASTTKLFSTATALDALGADYRFQTPVYRRGNVEAGVLHGDLILVASGDLTLGGRGATDGKIAFANTDHTYESHAQLTDPDPLAGIDQLARQVAQSGIQRVTGDVYVDDRLFEPSESSGSGPTQVTPIVVNDNVIDVKVKATSPGQPASIEWRPETSLIQLDADVLTVEAEKPAKLRVVNEGRGRIVVRGEVSMPPDGQPLEEVIRIVEVEDPASFARGLFLEALARHGVHARCSKFAANPSLNDVPRAFTQEDRVAVLESAPFSENLKLILKVSHNLHASTLPLLVAVQHGKRHLESGLQLEREFLARAGVPVTSISFGGGAGGSSADLITPVATVELLRAMSRRADFSAYFDALPVLGVDGTLFEAVPSNSPARGKVHAKTGTYWVHNTLLNRKLLTSKALAGYMTAKSGRELAFALFVNYIHLERPDDRRMVGQTLGKICEIWHEAF